MLLAAGVTMWFGTQAFVNIGAVIGILPITGVPAALRQLRRVVAALQHDRAPASSSTSLGRRRLPDARPPSGPPRRRSTSVAVTPVEPPSPSSPAVAPPVTCYPPWPSPTPSSTAGHPRPSIHYVGAERGIEARLVPPTGYPMTLLPGRGIQRRLTVANLGALAGLLVAGVRALRLVGRLRPAVVVAVGGYASVAVGLAAVLRRVPVVVAEQNQAPGAANRLVGPLRQGGGGQLPRHRPAAGGGHRQPDPRRDHAPSTRRAIGRPPSAPSGVEPGRQLLLVFGGSLGALRLNEAVLGALPRWRDRVRPGRPPRRGPARLGRRRGRRPRPTSGLWPLAPGGLRGRHARRPGGRRRRRVPVGLEHLLRAGRRRPAVRSSCLRRSSPPTSRRATPATSSRPGPPSWCPTPTLDGPRLVAEVDALLADDQRLAGHGRGRPEVGPSRRRATTSPPSLKPMPVS